MGREIDNDFLDIENNDIETKKNKSIFRKIFFILVLIIIITIIYARYIGTTGLIIKEYSIKNSNITKSYDGFKIAHFSDFHYGRTTGINELKILVNEINSIKPDIVVFTGDFVDKDIKISDQELSKIIDELKKINSSYGNYYVNGNHDLKYDKFYEMFDTANFINLNDNYDVIYSKTNDAILLSGLSTNENFEFLNKAFENSNYIYKINIMHYPDYFDDIKKYNFNLVLAGHSHNGNIRIPYIGALKKVDGSKKYDQDYYKVKTSDLYISSGLGTNGPGFRLFCRPSFNFFRVSAK